MFAILFSLLLFMNTNSAYGVQEVIPVYIGRDVTLTCDSEEHIRWRMEKDFEAGGFHGGYVEGELGNVFLLMCILLCLRK